MFTGIIEELGSIADAGPHRLRGASRNVVEDAPVGASIAVNGVCLTVVENDGSHLAFDLSDETLTRSTLAGLRPGDPVNLERPVMLLSRLGGHLVQGHVDGVGSVRSVTPAEGGVLMALSMPGDLGRYVVEKGSVTVDGVSLTVAGIDGDTFSVALIPHTLRATTLGTLRPGDQVNLEVDVIARYVEQMGAVAPSRNGR